MSINDQISDAFRELSDELAKNKDGDLATELRIALNVIANKLLFQKDSRRK